MNASQKEAWFNLVVVLSALIVVAAIVPFLGKGAMGGFGLLGFLGLSPVFFRKRHGAVVLDDEILKFACVRSFARISFLVAVCARRHDSPGSVRLEWLGSRCPGDGECLVRVDRTRWGDGASHLDPVWSGRPRCRLMLMSRGRSTI